MRILNFAVQTIITAMSIYSLTHLFSHKIPKNFVFEMNFCSLVASLFYTTFLMIYECSIKISDNYQQIGSENEKKFFTSTFSKFLFPIFFCTFFY